MSDLRVSAEFDEGVCRVKATGEARLETAAEFDRVRHEIAERGATRVLVDLTGLEFMDSASTGMLIALKNQLAAEEGGALVLHGLRRPVARLFERTGLTEEFECVETEAEAEAHLQ